MAIWRAYIDDSSSEGAILNYDFSPKPIQKMDGTKEEDESITRAMSAGLVVVKGANLSAMTRELTSLRREIKDRHKLIGSELPRFHMRHLWGENPNSDEGKNPFAHLSKR